MTAFDQRAAPCRCKWGAIGLAALAPADVVIVVDVLSFSTCVDIAVSLDAAVLPYDWRDASGAAFAERQRAELAGPRRSSRYSLSPVSFVDAAAGLRCVLPSPNGAALTLREGGDVRRGPRWLPAKRECHRPSGTATRPHVQRLPRR